MSQPNVKAELRNKLNEVRNRLLGSLSTEELQNMQLHMDVLEKAMLQDQEDHHHDEDHDGHNDHSHSDPSPLLNP